MASQMAFVQVGVPQETVVDVESEDSPLMGGRGQSGLAADVRMKHPPFEYIYALHFLLEKEDFRCYANGIYIYIYTHTHTHTHDESI